MSRLPDHDPDVRGEMRRPILLVPLILIAVMVIFAGEAQVSVGREETESLIRLPPGR